MNIDFKILRIHPYFKFAITPVNEQFLTLKRKFLQARSSVEASSEAQHLLSPRCKDAFRKDSTLRSRACRESNFAKRIPLKSPLE